MSCAPLPERFAKLCRDAAFCVIALTICTAGSVAAQPVAQPRRTLRPRVDLAAGLTTVRVRELPPRDGVGQGALSVFANAAYLWTPHLATQVEITSQVERFNWDYDYERVVGSRVATITLKHNYEVTRRTVAQLVQLGPRRLVPYFGAGTGIESQTTYDTWYESRVVLGPDAKTVSEFPDSSISRGKADRAIVFVEAGGKMFLASHAYFLVDWKFARNAGAHGMFGLGVRLP